ncbi:hypothetical protein PRUPE_1G555800 [Prunus persica]|uniref:DUF1232 domain-containing protein n=1 Tax=Prunus persica TaxID=3760 RepID=A0A251RKW1_PRUPE|nr:hypothetical protein PRUPE_1G555800 [Prunus persica]
MDDPPGSDMCSVCHGNFDTPCQANCSHWFCEMECAVWHHGSALQPASLRQADRPEVAEILGKVERYNRYFGDHPRSLIQRGQDLPFFLRRLLRELIDPNRSLPARRMAQICFAMILLAIYLVSPVDLIPEAMFGLLGYVDDFIVALVILFNLAAISRSILYHRHGGS